MKINNYNNVKLGNILADIVPMYPNANSTFKGVMSKVRKKEDVEPRHIFIYVVRNLSNSFEYSNAKIAGFLNRDHSLVNYVTKKFRNIMSVDKNFKQLVERIETKIKADYFSDIIIDQTDEEVY